MAAAQVAPSSTPARRPEQKIGLNVVKPQAGSAEADGPRVDPLVDQRDLPLALGAHLKKLSIIDNQGRDHDNEARRAYRRPCRRPSGTSMLTWVARQGPARHRRTCWRGERRSTPRTTAPTVSPRDRWTPPRKDLSGGHLGRRQGRRPQGRHRQAQTRWCKKFFGSAPRRQGRSRGFECVVSGIVASSTTRFTLDVSSRVPRAKCIQAISARVTAAKSRATR